MREVYYVGVSFKRTPTWVKYFLITVLDEQYPLYGFLSTHPIQGCYGIGPDTPGSV